MTPKNKVATKTQGVNVEELMTKYGKNAATSAQIKAAMETLAQEEEKKKKETLIQQIADVQSITSKFVSALRSVRAIEKAAKERLEKVAVAEQRFMESGDYDAYLQEIFRIN